MGVRINHNIAALNAWWNLTKTDTSIRKSLEKLSSGYRINRAGDDPAGLVISEKLRANITGLDQAIKNSEDAVSMVQTAEGALTEMHTLLNSIRALALHSANEGANDSAAVAADQAQVDSSVDSIDRIANTTKYAGKYLLNGSSGNTATINNNNRIANVSVGNYASTGSVSYAISREASYAEVSGGVLITATSTGVHVTVASITINGIQITFSGGSATIAGMVSAINHNSSLSGVVSAWVSSATGGYHLMVATKSYGRSATLVMSGDSNIVSGTQADVGQDIGGTIHGYSASGSGLELIALSGTFKDMGITINASYNSSSGTSLTSDLTVTAGLLKFVLGANGESNETATISIASMRANKLGTSTAGSDGLLAIKSGGTYDLDSDASTAIDIIDEAINDVSSQRSSLGAFQKNTLESTIANLGVTRENIQSSESRIRDVDMASEMVQFTRLQILMQAGTAMLAQANVAPQSILQLLG